MADPSKVSTPEEVAEAMDAYRRQTGHYPPAVMLHPDTLHAIKGALAAAMIAAIHGNVDLLTRPHLPLGLLIFCERDGSLPGAKSPLLSVGHAELFITDSSGAKKSLGAVTDIRIDDPEDILRIPTYAPASPAELARRLAEEFGDTSPDIS